MSDVISKERLFRFQNTLFQWTESCKEATNEIKALADNLDEHFGRIMKAKIGGSTAGIAGGILAAVGFGLSFVTFGASLGLSIAGGIIAGSGGAVVGGSMASDAILSRKRKQRAEEILQKYNAKMGAWKKECVEIGKKLEEKLEQSNGHVSMENGFPHWFKFWFDLVIGTGQTAKSTGWDIIGKTILTSLRIVTSFDDAAFSGVRVGASLFKTLGTTARGLHIAGGVIGIALIPLDIYTLVDSAVGVYKKKPHKTADGIRQIAERIEKACPSKNEIETMIRETSNKL